MSNGDDGPDSAEEPAAETEDALDAEAAAPALDPESLGDRLDDAEAALDDAETEADLDDVAAALDDVAAGMPEEPEDDEADEDVAAARDRLTTLRDDLEAARGPYAEDVATALEDAESTVTDSEWTGDGESSVVAAVEAFLEAAGEQLSDTVEPGGDDTASLAAAVGEVRTAVLDADLDPDEDDETVAALLEAAETLADDLDAAEVWSDLTVQEQLDAQGFYDVLESENRKDYPAEWNAVKLYEKAYKQGDTEAVEMILLALDRFTSDFMEENTLDSLRRIAPPEALDEIAELAGGRNKDAIDILGRIGDDSVLETLHDFIDGGDVALRKTTLQAVGAIGSKESTQPVANQLADDNSEVRSTAARALGLIGDTRAIEPLADVLAEDGTDEVRASAAWALNTIGTERARAVAADYTDDSAYIVQAEAEKAADATERAA